MFTHLKISFFLRQKKYPFCLRWLAFTPSTIHWVPYIISQLLLATKSTFLSPPISERREREGLALKATIVMMLLHFEYSLVGVVMPNTELLISRPFAGLYKIRLLLWDRKRTKNFRNKLALLQLQLYLQLQQNTCSLTQILVNKSDKYDHPHQWEPWHIVEVVNKVGAEAMPTNF